MVLPQTSPNCTQPCKVSNPTHTALTSGFLGRRLDVLLTFGGSILRFKLILNSSRSLCVFTGCISL